MMLASYEQLIEISFFDIKKLFIYQYETQITEQ